MYDKLQNFKIMAKDFSFTNDFGTFKKGDKVIANCLDGKRPVNYIGELTNYCGGYVEINKNIIVHYLHVKHYS